MDPIPTDDSDCGAGCGIPTDMQASADPSHVHDCPVSTPEPVGHMAGHQRRPYRSSPAAQTDASPAHTGDSSRDVRSDASSDDEDSNQNDGPGFGPDDIADRPSLPVICSCYTLVGETEQNQALSVGNPLVEAEQKPSKHIYGTEVDTTESVDLPYSMSGRPSEAEEPIYGCRAEVDNAESVVQYQLRGTRHREALSTCYRRGPDVDHAGTDRQDGEVCDADSEAGNIGHDEVQTETVAPQPEDTGSSSQNRTGSAVPPGNECILDEQIDAQQHTVTSDEDMGHCGLQTSTVRNGLRPNPMYSGNGLRPNPMYGGNALPLNPAYVPNIPRPSGGQSHASTIITVVIIVLTAIFIGLFISTFIPGEQYSFIPTAWPNPIFTARTDGSGHADYSSPAPHPTRAISTAQTDGHVDPTSTEGKEPDEVAQTTSAVDGKEHEAGMLRELICVVASPSHEVFVSSASDASSSSSNKWVVTVIDAWGTVHRSFPTIKAESKCDAPGDISIGGRGPLWAVGNCYPPAAGLIVQYTKKKHDIPTVHPYLPINTFLGIAKDALYDRTVDLNFTPDYVYLLVTIKDDNGTDIRQFRMPKGLEMHQGYPGLVTVGRGGDLSLVDHWDIHVYGYNGTGHRLLSFGDGDRRTEIMAVFRTCTDSMIKCLFPHN